MIHHGVCAAALLGILGGTLEAGVVRVRDDAGLRRALAAATAGTHVLLEGGEYRGGIRAAGLHGKPGKPILIAAVDPARPPVIAGGSTCLHLSSVSHIELRDLVLKGARANGLNLDDGGNREVPSHHVVLRNLTVSDIGSRGNHDGIKLSGVEEFVLDNCVIERWGSEGQGVDMVGCHDGVIDRCSLRFEDDKGSGIQAKGGSRNVRIRRCRFVHAGSRAVNLGGSTGLEFFRPPLKKGETHYEARDITVEGCTFVGSNAPVAFVGVDGAAVRCNTIQRPRRWVLRILQETRADGFVPSRGGSFSDNIVVFRSDELRTAVNIGPGTAPETFAFARNWWYCTDRPAASRPSLPTPETNGHHGEDPRLRNPGTPWPAVDGLGRSLPLEASAGPPKPGRFVGIFYFLWLGQHNSGDRVYDVARILRENPRALQTPTSPPWGPVGCYHWWAEPLYGYYLAADPWVLRRHARLLTDAGVDTLIFDATNRVTYRPVYMKVCEVFRRIRREGGRTPQITFMTHTRAGETAAELYRDLYKPGKYREIWFRWEGKPLLICDPAEASAEVRAFFTLRRAHWPFTQVNTPYAWHWEAAYPQVYGYTEHPQVPEQVNVSVAQNLRRSDGKVTNMSDGNARGRSFHDGDMDRRAGAVNHGFNFQEQWKRALELDPPFVMVTGWNEWIAGRWRRPGKPLVFVDQFDQEYSRDIEPMKGGHGDNYYMQLVANVRRYKGVPPLPEASGPKTIGLEGDFAQWKDVRPAYRDTVLDTAPRDHAGASGLHYTDRTGRNDLVLLKAARDARNVYFYAETREPITSPRGPCWMLLLIDADQDAKTGWQGFDFIARREADGRSWLESNRGGWNWERVEPVDCRVSGNQLHLAVPRHALGLPSGDAAVRLDFKWADNLRDPGDIMDCHVSGDTAPEGRFRFRYSARP